MGYDILMLLLPVFFPNKFSHNMSNKGSFRSLSEFKKSPFSTSENFMETQLFYQIVYHVAIGNYEESPARPYTQKDIDTEIKHLL